jgi:hypothetical protein
MPDKPPPLPGPDDEDTPVERVHGQGEASAPIRQQLRMMQVEARTSATAVAIVLARIEQTFKLMSNSIAVLRSRKPLPPKLVRWALILAIVNLLALLLRQLWAMR